MTQDYAASLAPATQGVAPTGYDLLVSIRMMVESERESRIGWEE